MISVCRCFRTRWLAKAVLWLGLFGFAIGWANACLLHEPLQGAAQGAAAPMQAPHGPGDAGPHERNAALDDCGSPCTAPQNLVPKSEPPRLLDDAAWLPAMPAFAAAWTVDRAAPAQQPAPPRVSPPRLAVVLRFLRLTL